MLQIVKSLQLHHTLNMTSSHNNNLVNLYKCFLKGKKYLIITVFFIAKNTCKYYYKSSFS